MGLFERLRRLLDRGEPPNVDPSELVEIAVVPLSQAPLLVSGLRAGGFNAKFIEAFNPAIKSSSDARLLVARGEAVAATQLLDELR